MSHPFNPPHSNTGGKSSSSKTQGEISIDTLSITFNLAAVNGIVSGGIDPFIHSDDDLLDRADVILSYFFGAAVIQADERRGKKNFFDNSIVFKDKAGFMAWGGNNKVTNRDGDRVIVPERMQIYLPGEGTSLVHDWARVAKMLAAVEARITRTDVAYDDHEGKYDVDYCMAEYEAGAFVSNGAPPKAKYIDDVGTNEGRTFYVGKRQNGKMLRAYEKGKQLGDPTSLWVRWEVEFIAKDRDIPYDILINPKKYIAGAYPALSFISEIVEVIRTVQEKLEISFEVMTKFCRIAYGKLLNFSHKELMMEPDEIFYKLLNPKGYPDRIMSGL